MLFPAVAGVAVRGVLFNSDMFEGRGPARSETWIYGGVAHDLSRRAATPEALVSADRAVLTGRQDRPLAIYPNLWLDALPVYDEAVLHVGRCLPRLPPWLRLAGNYLGRLGVSGLLDTAACAVSRLADRPLE